jgi:hypothetical protein
MKSKTQTIPKQSYHQLHLKGSEKRRKNQEYLSMICRRVRVKSLNLSVYITIHYAAPDRARFLLKTGALYYSNRYDKVICAAIKDGDAIFGNAISDGDDAPPLVPRVDLSLF